MGRTCARHPAGTRPARPSLRARCVREPPSGNCVSAARGRVDAEAQRGPRSRRADRAGADRRNLLRTAARDPHARGRKARGVQYPRVRRRRDRAGVPGGLRRREATRRSGVLGRQGQRARGERAVARGRDEGRGRVRRRRAEPPVRGQCGDAARSRSKAVRRHRDEQHVRRHPVGPRLHADGVDRDAALGIARCIGEGTLRADPWRRAGHLRHGAWRTPSRQFSPPR